MDAKDGFRFHTKDINQLSIKQLLFNSMNCFTVKVKFQCFVGDRLFSADLSISHIVPAMVPRNHCKARIVCKVHRELSNNGACFWMLHLFNITDVIKWLRQTYFWLNAYCCPGLTFTFCNICILIIMQVYSFKFPTVHV